MSFPNVWVSYPFEEGVAVYMIGKKDDEDRLMFAVMNEDKVPLKISLRCDYILAKVLREKYIEVMPAEKLSKRDWNTLVLTGQLTWEDVQGLIRHSYDLTLSTK